MGLKYFFEPFLILYTLVAFFLSILMVFSLIFGTVEIASYGVKVSQYDSYTHGTCQVVGTQVFNKTCSGKFCKTCNVLYYPCYFGVWYLAVIENNEQVAIGKTNTLTTNLESGIVNELNKYPNGSLNGCWYETNNKVNVGWDAPDYPNAEKILGFVFLPLSFVVLILILILFLFTINWCYIYKKITARSEVEQLKI